MPPTKISQDKDLKRVVEYFDRKEPTKEELERRARKAAEKEAREREAKAKAEAEAEAKTRAEEEARAKEEEEAKALAAREEERKRKEDPLSQFDERAFDNPIKKLSAQKIKDYGYGVPQWSPYRMTKVTSTPEWKDKLWSTTNSEWGMYSKQKNALDPITQSRLARGLVLEMKANASIDHTWEVIGKRPGQDEGNKFFMP